MGDGSNWYVYCGNHPVALADPEGTVPIFALGLIFALVVATPTVTGIGKGEKPPPPGWQGGYDALIWSLVIPVEGYAIGLVL